MRRLSLRERVLASVAAICRVLGDASPSDQSSAAERDGVGNLYTSTQTNRLSARFTSVFPQRFIVGYGFATQPKRSVHLGDESGGFFGVGDSVCRLVDHSRRLARPASRSTAQTVGGSLISAPW